MLCSYSSQFLKPFAFLKQKLWLFISLFVLENRFLKKKKAHHEQIHVTESECHRRQNAKIRHFFVNGGCLKYFQSFFIVWSMEKYIQMLFWRKQKYSNTFLERVLRFGCHYVKEMLNIFLNPIYKTCHCLKLLQPVRYVPYLRGWTRSSLIE